MNEKNKKDEKQSFLIYKDKKLVKLRDELNSLQDEWNKKILQICLRLSRSS